MDRTTGSPQAHWYRSEDAHAESVVRAAYAPEARNRHMHWPAAAGSFVVAELDGRVVGRACMDAVWPPFAEIQNMEVLPPFRGRGAGGALVDECLRRIAQMGFVAAFLQTFPENVQAHRLYARKGFLIAAKGEMLRLVRFIGMPVLDGFLHEHPLATYGASADKPSEWSLEWSDWPTGDRLQLALSGGSCQRDSDGYGPALRGVSLATGKAAFSAQLTGPKVCARGGDVALSLELTNTSSDPLQIWARLLLPQGCMAAGKWENTGPAETIAPGASLRTDFAVTLGPELDLAALRGAAFPSVPLTVEVFAGDTSFWLSRSIKMREEKG